MGDVEKKISAPWQAIRLEQLGRQPVDVELHHDVVAPEAIGGNTEDLPANYYWSANFLGTMAAACLAQIAGYLGWVLPANTISLIVAELGPTGAAIWLAGSWQSGFAVGSLWVGRLSDIFGRRWFFLGFTVLAIIGNIIGASAQSVNTLIACNGLNGVAASGQLSFSVVVGELVSNKNRGLANDLVFITATPFAVFGPVIMRAFFQHTALTFRWSYIMGVIVNTLGAILFYLYYHPPSYELLHVAGKSRKQQLLALDFIGMFLFASGLVAFLVAINWAGSIYKWSDAHVLGFFFAGLIVLSVFCFWEARCPLEYPLMPTRLFRSKTYDAVVACASLAATTYYAGTVFWPTMVAALFTTSVSKIGWLSCAVGGGLLLGQVLGGIGLKYIPRMKIQMIVAAVLLTAFQAACASATPDSQGRTTAFVFLALIAAGYVENLTFSSVALLWEPDDIGLISGVLGCFRTATAALALSMYMTILDKELDGRLPQYLVPAALQAGLPNESVPALLMGARSGSFAAVPGLNETVIQAIFPAYQHAYTLAFRTVWLCTLPCGLLLLVVAIGWCPNVEDHLTSEVARKLQITTKPNPVVKLVQRAGKE